MCFANSTWRLVTRYRSPTKGLTLSCIVEATLIPVYWDVMLHILLFPKPPQSLSAWSNLTSLLPHPCKASLPLYSASFIHHLPFLSPSCVPFAWFLHLQPLCNPPDISNTGPLSSSLALCHPCPLPFLHICLALNHLSIFYFSLSALFLPLLLQLLSLSVCISFTLCSCFSRLHFFSPLFAHSHTSRAVCYAGSFARLLFIFDYILPSIPS